jgi:hypothetical protein
MEGRIEGKLEVMGSKDINSCGMTLSRRENTGN